MVVIEAPLRAMPFKRVEQSGRRRYNAEAYTAFKQELGWYAKNAMGHREPYTGAIAVKIHVCKKSNGILKACWGDLDNFVKAILDSLIGICYEDDAQVTQIVADKSRGRTGIWIAVREVER